MRARGIIQALRGGFTLVELLVVLLILAATAGLAVVLVGDKSAPAQEDATLVSQRTIQQAIFESGYQDDVRALPGRMADLTARRPWPTSPPNS